MKRRTIRPDTTDRNRIRLYNQYRRRKGWHKLAADLGINVKYLYRYVMEGITPDNKDVCSKLRILIPKPRRKLKTINQHMAEDCLSEMPPHLLYMALLYRS